MPRSKSPAPKSKTPSKKKTKVKESKYEALFSEIDTDGSGGIDAFELQHAMVSQFGVKLTTTQVPLCNLKHLVSQYLFG